MHIHQWKGRRFLGLRPISRRMPDGDQQDSLPAQNEARMDVKGFLCWVVVDVSKRAGAGAGWLPGWASGGLDRDKPPTWWGRSLQVTPDCARSGYVIWAEGGRSFVTQPHGCEPVRSGQTPTEVQAGCGRCLNTSLAA